MQAQRSSRDSFTVSSPCCAAPLEARGQRPGAPFQGPGGTNGIHVEHCRFPLAFCESPAALLLIHGTDWNRLDVSDPWTGQLLSARIHMSPLQEGEDHEHYLDYFHGRLTASPDGELLVDDGWVWAPAGIVRVFSLRRWIELNPWESEDGPTLLSLCVRHYAWDLPVCRPGAGTLAVWGEGDDDLELTPGVRIFDASTGDELRSFPGPAHGLIFADPYLLSHSSAGAAVWDVSTGEKLVTDPQVVPAGHHPTSRELVTIVPGEGLRLSRLERPGT